MKKETDRKNNTEAKQRYLGELRETQRVCKGLNTAIRCGDRDKVEHWQVITCLFYGIPFVDWFASQDKGDYSRLKEKWGLIVAENKEGVKI